MLFSFHFCITELDRASLFHFLCQISLQVQFLPFSQYSPFLPLRTSYLTLSGSRGMNEDGSIIILILQINVQGAGMFSVSQHLCGKESQDMISNGLDGLQCEISVIDPQVTERFSRIWRGGGVEIEGGERDFGETKCVRGLARVEVGMRCRS